MTVIFSVLKSLLCLIVAVLLFLQPAGAGAASGTVETVSVAVVSDEAAPPSRIAKRMASSVATVGEHLIIGRRIEELEQSRASYEKVVSEVLDRVLVGYSVREVTIAPGATANIQVKIVPWGDVVREVSLETDLGSLSPGLKGLILKDLGNMEEEVGNVLVGLPVDSVEWGGSITKSVIRELLAAKLPEFRSNFDIIPGPRTVVKLSLIPAGETVQDVAVSLKSETIPNILLLEARPAVQAAAQEMIGLPVAFVERRRDYFNAKLSAAAAGHKVAQRYGLTLSTAIAPGRDTEVVVDAETTKFKVNLEGYLDIGRNSPENTSARLHAGKNIGKKDEVFLEIDFVPSTFEWDVMPGWGRAIGSKTSFGAKYNVSDSQAVLWLRQDLSRSWSIRLERTPELRRNEVGLRFKVHDFLSAEYVANGDDNWLRLVGHL